MAYDHIIQSAERLTEKNFHLSCGYYTTTAFFFEGWDLSVTIDCNGTFTFRTADGAERVVKAKPMRSGRGCYMDILITTTDTGILFRLPEYSWWDHYPDCDGESDRWDAEIIGIRDEIVYPLS